MTDFSQSFQLGSALYQGPMLGSTAYVGGGYFPSNVTTNSTFSISNSTFNLTLSFSSTGATSATASTIQPIVSVTSTTSSSGQQDILLGINTSTTLVGGGTATNLSMQSGKKNGKDDSW